MRREDITNYHGATSICRWFLHMAPQLHGKEDKWMTHQTFNNFVINHWLSFYQSKSHIFGWLSQNIDICIYSIDCIVRASLNNWMGISTAECVQKHSVIFNSGAASNVNSTFSLPYKMRAIRLKLWHIHPKIALDSCCIWKHCLAHISDNDDNYVDDDDDTD